MKRELTSPSSLAPKPSNTPATFLATLLSSKGSNLAESSSFPTTLATFPPSFIPTPATTEFLNAATAVETTSVRRELERER